MTKFLVITGCALLLAIACFAYQQISIANTVARESAQRALFKEAQALLEKHHNDNGEYPEQLVELNFTYPDGGDESLLEDFEYSVDASGYRLRTVGYSSQQVFEAGAKVQQPH